MVIMSTNDVSTTEENRSDLASDASLYILDETGDTLLDTLPKNVSVPRDLSTTFEDIKIDLSSTAGSKADLSTSFEDAKEVLSTVENEDSIASSTVKGQEMFRISKSVPLKSTPGNGRKPRKRKRKTPTHSKQKNTTPRLGSGREPNKKRKREKSVIVIGSDSEPDDSVIEIDDESIIVLSDEEVGVCTGTTTGMVTRASTIKNVNENLKNQEKVTAVKDLTGDNVSSKAQLSSKKDPSPEQTKKNVVPLTKQSDKRTGLRPVIIDGCNVAFGHGRDRFSSLGLKICVDYFKKLGHEVRVFIPQFRKHHNATTDPQLLDEMEKDGTLCYTPSRRTTDGKMIVSYDDRFIVEYADSAGGVIVSKDNYRDLLNESPEWKDTISKRLLMYTWVGDTIMFPKDPLGRHGPNLEEFLKF